MVPGEKTPEKWSPEKWSLEKYPQKIILCQKESRKFERLFLFLSIDSTTYTKMFDVHDPACTKL